MVPRSHEIRDTKEPISSSTDEHETNEWGHGGSISDRDKQAGDDNPTLVLDVPVLNIDEIDLEVEDLRAHVSLRAELADFVKVNVGIDVYLDKVKLDIKGVEAQALLKVNLDRVLGTLDRALEAIDKNPQILDTFVGVNSGIGGPSQGASQSARRTEQDVDRTSNESSEAVSKEATDTLADLQIEEEYIDERGQIIGRARDESGNLLEEVLDEEGDVLDSSVPEEDREPEDDGKVDATDAARRKADELGVKLSDVQGTGSNGRVLVKDVERAAK